MVQNRVSTVLVEADRQVPGSAAADPGAEKSEVLDDLAEAVLRMGGEAIALEADRVPSKTGAAAVFRYLGRF